MTSIRLELELKRWYFDQMDVRVFLGGESGTFYSSPLCFELFFLFLSFSFFLTKGLLLNADALFKGKAEYLCVSARSHNHHHHYHDGGPCKVHLK